MRNGPVAQNRNFFSPAALQKVINDTVYSKETVRGAPAGGPPEVVNDMVYSKELAPGSQKAHRR